MLVLDHNLLSKICLKILIGLIDVTIIFYLAAVTGVRKVSGCSKAAYAVVAAETI
jgi:hypothetical protein